MKVLVVGSGGREHAICWSIKKSSKATKIFCAPGNAGIAEIVNTVNIDTSDLDSLLNFALKEEIDLTIVGPEQPLSIGIVDLFRENGLLIFGPDMHSAQLESSKEFSKILVDAPCSGERHQIHSGKTSEWSLKRSKSLAMKQYTLLCAALLCAQTEARIVYSTCSINPVENDEVVRRFLKKKKDFVKAASDVFSESTKNALEKSVGLEQTELGWIILPDTQGYGPIYFSAIQKTS